MYVIISITQFTCTLYYIHLCWKTIGMNFKYMKNEGKQHWNIFSTASDIFHDKQNVIISCQMRQNRDERKLDLVDLKQNV